MGSLAFMFFATYSFVALLTIGVSIPLILRRVPRNHIMGVRTRKSLSSDAIWYPANVYGGRCMATAGIIIFVCVTGLYAIPAVRGGIVYCYACIAVLLGTLAVAVVKIMRYLARL